MRWTAVSCCLLVFALILAHVVPGCQSQRLLHHAKAVRLGVGRFYNRVSAIRRLVM